MNFATDLSIIQYIFTNLFLSFLFIFIYDVANTINVYDVHVQHTFIYRIYVRFVCVNVIVVVVVVSGDDDVCKCSLADNTYSVVLVGLVVCCCVDFAVSKSVVVSALHGLLSIVFCVHDLMLFDIRFVPFIKMWPIT